MVVNVLLGLLGILFVYYFIFYVRDLMNHKGDWGEGNVPINLFIGFITNFLDTLGIGSYATTTMLLGVTKQLKSDKLLPGTLNVADTIPVLIEAFLFISVVEVESVTLFSLIIAAIIGAVIGGKTVPNLSEKKVQTYLGFALLITALLMLGKQLGLMAFLGTGNTATGLEGPKLILAVVLNLIFGALMTIGCGLYAPCMAMVYLLGLNPIVAFPVMMGSCAALMPVASKEFIVSGVYARKISVIIAISGIFGVVVAAKLVQSMDLNILTWLVIIVVIYTAFMYIRKGLKNKEEAAPAGEDDNFQG